MDLPDAPKKTEVQLDDTSAIMNFQENQNQIEKKEMEPKQVSNVQLVEQSPADDLKLPEGTSIVALAAEYAHQLSMQKEPQPQEEKIEKTET